ncbi:RdRP-domain-containing protein [Irpex rosettiformis]|uniref:RdRP-domain-containing protein n=1 Tax=Irpex rosettiformis TaxID=378272 RepID=A0ACB8UI24_9APHY|nr:RdRP-domain-containing protein [Irpex rosettiformis]
MEVYVQNISTSANRYNMKRTIAEAIHGDTMFSELQAVPINLEIVIFPQARRGQYRCGALTLPTAEIGRRFLRKFGQGSSAKIRVGNIPLIFRPSHKAPLERVLDQITRLPYVDPKAQEEREDIVEQLHSRTVQVTGLQFGWECRDGTFSVEWEKSCQGLLMFDLDKREYRMTYYDYPASPLRTVAVRSIHIEWAALGTADHPPRPALFLSLQRPPIFEAETSIATGSTIYGDRPLGSRTASGTLRQRHSSLGDDHSSSAQFTSLAVRFLFASQDAIASLAWIAENATHLKVDNVLPTTVRLGLFSRPNQDAYANFVRAVNDFAVAFQIERLIHNHIMDFKEVLALRPHIELMLRRHGSSYTAAFIQHLATQCQAVYTSRRRDASSDFVRELWLDCRKNFDYRNEPIAEVGAQADTFMCLHVMVTPTRLILDGPYPEKNNRVMRQYPENTFNFLRVNFADDTGYLYRVDRDKDDQTFIHQRFGGVLQNGLDIAGRHFEFLAYTQSSLKQHAVWFMKPFVIKSYDRKVTVTPDIIIRSIGVFNDVEYDPRLIYCPARYGARISQAFTATEAAVAIGDIEEIPILPDILDTHGRSFTDGVGTMSREFAQEAWKQLQAVSQRHARNKRIEYPPAFQVRCRGSKGMLSVDYRLPGIQICLRQSMVKFETQNSMQVEIVAAFTSPGKFYLNRPLVMMLEDLKIFGGYNILKKLQSAVIDQTTRAMRSLQDAASLFEGHGLGTSFKLASVFLSLHKLGIDVQSHQLFRQLTEFAVHHVLRELKYRARIPVPDGWTLPGIADIHGYLREGQVYACIASNDGSEPQYLDGRVMVLRSPVIHPGDVQVWMAIGKPPSDSPFIHERLLNTLVFPTNGRRPPASYLAGGDLDGDEFVVCKLPEMMPTRTFLPANYDPAQRQYLDRPSTRADIADFVTKYIYSDSIGLIASAWLAKADSSDKGIHDSDCLALAALHSDAVDYPKTGMAVPIDRIPRNKSSAKPDWSCPELTVGDNTTLYYESQRWLGKLFREIKLPEPHMPHIYLASRQRNVEMDRVVNMFKDNTLYSRHQPGGEIVLAVRIAVSEFIDPWRHSKSQIRETWKIFQEFAYELNSICVLHVLSTARAAMLTEEEALVGTIVAKCTDQKKRKEQTAKLRERTTNLFDRTARQVVGPGLNEGDDFKQHTEGALRRAWVAYGVSLIFRRSEFFGSQSFGILALSEIFDAIKKLEAISSEST